MFATIQPIQCDIKTLVDYYNKVKVKDKSKVVDPDNFIAWFLNSRLTSTYSYPAWLVNAAHWRTHTNNKEWKRDKYGHNAVVFAYEGSGTYSIKGARTLIDDIKGIVRYYNFQNKKGIKEVVDQDLFSEWFLYKRDTKANFPNELIKMAEWRLSIDEDKKKLSKLHSLRGHFGYSANVLAFKTKRLMRSSSHTLSDSVGMLKRIAYELIKRNKAIMTAKLETILLSYEELVKIHGEDKAKEIGIQSPQVYSCK